MSDLQVLVATVNQPDFSLAGKMNIMCDAVFANQCGKNKVQTCTTEGGTWKMISTDTLGVGLNRNIALFAANADIVLFSDDDITYYDGTLAQVKTAFAAFPDADVIIFSVDLEKRGEIYERRRVPHKKMHIWNAMKYGTYSIAAKRKSLIKNNITFHHCFGGGALYGSGEDSLFLKECFDKKLKVYSYDYVLGKCNKDQSSWFSGFNEKFFYDKGALFGCLFPRLKYVMLPVFAAKFNKTDIPVGKRLKYMFAGMVNVKKLIPFGEDA